MDTQGAILKSMALADMICQGYLGDLTDSELMIRAVPGVNHIAWQLGHLIASEHGLISDAFPGVMPPLPEGFKARHSKETASDDNPAHFLKKAEYLKLGAEQRQGTLAALAKQTDADFDKPAPESMRSYAPTIGDLFTLMGSHWLMHAGQWAVVRRKQGRPPLF
jgi:hypothetical protein